jgi:hypothetical protein
LASARFPGAFDFAEISGVACCFATLPNDIFPGAVSCGADGIFPAILSGRFKDFGTVDSEAAVGVVVCPDNQDGLRHEVETRGRTGW